MRVESIERRIRSADSWSKSRGHGVTDELHCEKAVCDAEKATVLPLFNCDTSIQLTSVVVLCESKNFLT